jgi:flagellar basal-body rod modification protein FlgD
MQVSSINGSDLIGAPSDSRIPMQVLDQEDFLKLFVAQLTSQDPLNPKSDTDFVAQMAQFSSLEQNRAMQGDMAKLQANSLIGRLVEFQDQNGLVRGVVEAVQMDAGTPKLVVNGKGYDIGSVRAIEPAPVNNT